MKKRYKPGVKLGLGVADDPEPAPDADYERRGPREEVESARKAPQCRIGKSEVGEDEGDECEDDRDEARLDHAPKSLCLDLGRNVRGSGREHAGDTREAGETHGDLGSGSEEVGLLHVSTLPELDWNQLASQACFSDSHSANPAYSSSSSLLCSSVRS